MNDSICSDTDSTNSILCTEYDAIYCITTTNVTIDSYSDYNYGLLGQTSTQDIYCKLSMKLIILVHW